VAASNNQPCTVAAVMIDGQEQSENSVIREMQTARLSELTKLLEPGSRCVYLRLRCHYNDVANWKDAGVRGCRSRLFGPEWEVGRPKLKE